MFAKAPANIAATGGETLCQVPEHEQQDQVLRRRQPDHGDEEQGHRSVQASLLPARAPLMRQMARDVRRRVDEHQHADPGGKQAVQRREPIELERQPQVPCRRPWHVDAAAARRPTGRERGRDDRGEADRDRSRSADPSVPHRVR